MIAISEGLFQFFLLGALSVFRQHRCCRGQDTSGDEILHFLCPCPASTSFPSQLLPSPPLTVPLSELSAFPLLQALQIWASHLTSLDSICKMESSTLLTHMQEAGRMMEALDHEFGITGCLVCSQHPQKVGETPALRTQ